MTKDTENIKDTITESKNELNYALKLFESKISENNTEHQKILNLIEKNAKTLSDSAEKISQSSGMLCLIPNKIQKQITDIIPEIASTINKMQQESLDANYEDFRKKHDEYLAMLDEMYQERRLKINNMYDALLKQTKTYTKRKIIGIFLTFLVSTIFAGLTSFTILKYYPSHVTINTDSTLNVERSNLYLWGKNSIIQKNTTK